MPLRLWIWALILLILAAYATNLQNGFVYDDDVAIRISRTVSQGLYSEVWKADFWGRSEGVTTGTYRPLPALTFAIQWQMAPNQPFSFLVVNLLLVVLVSLLVFFLARRFLPDSAAFLAAGLFALHPVNAEITHNIVQRAELMSSIFVLLYLLVTWQRGSIRIGFLRIVLGGILYALVLLSKESGVVAPGILLLLVYADPQTKQDWRSTLRRTWPVLAVSVLVFAAYMSLRISVLGQISRDVPLVANPTVALPELWRHLNGGWLLLNYLLRFVWPFPQPMEWTYNQLAVFGPEQWPRMLGAWLVLLTLAGLTIWGLARRRLPAIGVTWGVLALSPVVQALATVTVLFADRCLFLPSIGLSLAAASMISTAETRWRSRTPRLFVLGSLLLLIFLAYQITIGPRWRDNPSLFASLAANAPNCANAQLGYGKFLYAEEKFEEARAILDRTIEIAPFWDTPYQWRGYVNLARHELTEAVTDWDKVEELASPLDLDELHQEQSDRVIRAAMQQLKPAPALALKWFELAIQRYPETYLAYAGRSLALQNLGRNQAAESARVRWLARFPSHPENDVYLAFYFDAAGDLAQALKHQTRAVAADPENSLLLQRLALLQEKAGLRAEAIERLQAWLTRHPGDRPIRALHHDMLLRQNSEIDRTRLRPGIDETPSSP